ncbi:MAG: hypothetical protein CNB20_00045 [Pelagibacterales bacterium MED-G43]|nr:MAG: hypothetical protein CNB20_00045 [Pelagibacterales bacterium MED-G43]
MKKFIISVILLIIIVLISFFTILSTLGIETTKFNSLISNKFAEAKNINLKLNTIKFKIDPRELRLFLETQNPEIVYKDATLPAYYVKVYVDFPSLLKSNFKIKKISLISKELDVNQIKKISSLIKPSNSKSFLNNKIKEGKVNTEVEIFLSDQGSFQNFIAKGKISDLEIELINNYKFSRANLNFFADKNDILIQNIKGDLQEIKISNGDIKLNLENGLKLESNFNSKVDLSEKQLDKYADFFDKYNSLGELKSLKTDLNNNIFIKFDSTYKIKDFNYSFSGKIERSKLKLTNPLANLIIKEKIKEIYFSGLEIKTVLKPKYISLKSLGEYSLNGSDYSKINLENTFKNDLVNLKIDFDYLRDLELDLINYKKNENSNASVQINIKKDKKTININKLNFKEKNNIIEIDNLKLRDNKLLSFEKIKVATERNNFFMQGGKKILIKGSKFDASNLTKFLNNQTNHNSLKNINSNIEIDFKNIKVPMSEKLQNFKLLGKIERGQFTKISSKGDFGGNNFLDISMKKDKDSENRYLEIYSDITRPLLTEYNFFKGLSGGKLLFTSVIDKSQSYSKLKIENFKVVNAPGVVQLLSLADLGGLADLSRGDGLSFDLLEIDMEKNKDSLKLNEILALGPSMSVLMEGYQNKDLTSLRGTLVPAKTLNKMISKIPVIGNIVIPKEAGEGLFGISFKMKGTKGKLKTTINPIRTLTPRFLQKIIDKKKQVK